MKYFKLFSILTVLLFLSSCATPRLAAPLEDEVVFSARKFSNIEDKKINLMVEPAIEGKDLTDDDLNNIQLILLHFDQSIRDGFTKSRVYDDKNATIKLEVFLLSFSELNSVGKYSFFIKLKAKIYKSEKLLEEKIFEVSETKDAQFVKEEKRVEIKRKVLMKIIEDLYTWVEGK